MTDFADGFDSGNLSVWTGTIVAGGCTFAPSTDVVHHGSHSGKATIDGNNVDDYS